MKFEDQTNKLNEVIAQKTDIELKKSDLKDQVKKLNE